MDVEDSTTFIYVEEGMREEASYQAPLSSTGIELEEITLLNETTLSGAPASMNGRASQAASISVNMDPASKRMVDDLVDSETTDEDEDPEFIHQSMNGHPLYFAGTGYGPSPAGDNGDETSYGLIGSSTVREHFGDLQVVPNSPRPLLPSISNSPFALQPGEEAPGSRPSSAKRKTPSHSQQNSQSRFPLQRQAIGFSVESSSSNPSTMPDPKAPGPHAHRNHTLNNVFPPLPNYTRGPRTSAAFENRSLNADEPNFLSLQVFKGSTWGGGSDQSGRLAADLLTPANGQGAG